MKCVFEIFDPLFGNRSDVEAEIHFPLAGAYEVAGDEPIPLLLLLVYRLCGGIACGYPRFYLDKAIGILFARHDIRFPEGRFVVTFENFISVFFEIFYGEFLTLPSQNFFMNVRLCSAHAPTSLIAAMCASVP